MIAVAYVRYSSDNQREESIEAQKSAIEQYCERNNHQLAKVYSDSAESARTDDRPAFQQMIRDSANGIFSCIIVHKLDRFSRNRYDSAYYKKKLRENDVKLISVLENLDDSPESIILESVLEGMAEYYSANLARETMKGLMETAKQCKHCGGVPPFGYDIGEDKKYIINDHEAIAVRFIFDEYIKGKTYTYIISWLNRNGYKTKQGNDFKETSLNSILLNEKYYGVFVFNKTKRKTSSRRIKADIFKIENGMPAIITENQYLEAMKIMNQNKSSGHKATEIYILTGILRCGICGAGMVGSSKWNGKKTILSKYYQCPSVKKKLCNMSAKQKSDTEDRIIKLYKFYLDDAEKLAKSVYQKMSKNNSSYPNNIEILTKELNSIDKEIENIINAIAAGMFHMSLKQKMDSLEDKKKNIQFQITEERLKSIKNEFDYDEILYFIKSKQDIDNMNDTEKKSAIRTFILSAEIQNDGTINIDTIVDADSCGGATLLLSTKLSHILKINN